MGVYPPTSHVGQIRFLPIELPGCKGQNNHQKPPVYTVGWDIVVP